MPCPRDPKSKEPVVFSKEGHGELVNETSLHIAFIALSGKV